MSERLVWADNAKAIGIFLVVLGHLSFADPLNLGQFIFSFHMPLFFILSGFFAPTGRIRSGDYILRSLKHIIVPYFFFMALTWPWYATLIWLNRASYGITEFTQVIVRTLAGTIVPFNNDIHSEWSIFTNGNLWFLLGLFWVKCLYSFMCNRSEWLNAILCVVCLSITVILKNYGLDALPLYFHSLFFAYPFFIIGVYLKKTGFLIQVNHIPAWGRMLITLMCFIGCYIVSLLNGRMSIGSITFGRSVILCIITGIVGSLGVIILSQSSKQFYLFSVLGGGTITVLALHGPFIQIISLLLRRIGVEMPVPLWGALIEALIIVIICIPIIIVFDRFSPKMVGKWK